MEVTRSPQLYQRTCLQQESDDQFAMIDFEEFTSNAPVGSFSERTLASFHIGKHASSIDGPAVEALGAAPFPAGAFGAIVIDMSRP